MKKLLYSALIVALTLQIGCKKTDNPQQQAAIDPKISVTTFDSTKLSTTVLGENEAKNVMLAYKPAKGSTFVYRLTSLTQDERMMKQDRQVSQALNQTITYIISVKINNIEDDGTVESELTINSVNFNANINGEKVQYKSGDKLDSAKKSQFVEYEALVNNPIGARTRPNGELLEIFKTDKILNKILQLRNASRDTIPTQQLAYVKQQLEEGGLRPMISQIFRKLNDSPVSKGTAWESTSPPLNLQVLIFNHKGVYNLNSIEKLGDDKIANLSLGLTYTTTVNPEIKKQGGQIKHSELQGEGQLYFNITKGMFQKNKTKMTLGLDFSAKIPTPQGVKSIESKTHTISSYILELMQVK